jgi:beta-hydroxylase
MFSGVESTPILNVEDFPQLRPLRDHWLTIREEAAHLYAHGHIRASNTHDDLGFNSFFRRGWKRFYIQWYGEPLPSAQMLCPRTVELVRSIPDVHGAMFALMEPHTRVGKHRDPFAGSLRYHLGLITPNSDDCRIFIDGTPHSWRDGQDLLFDETYVHHFENRTSQPRVVLFCDVERPIRNPLMRAVNRWVIANLLPLTATNNVEGESVGFANRAFSHLYVMRPPLRRLKKSHRRFYYALKYASLLAAISLVLITTYHMMW